MIGVPDAVRVATGPSEQALLSQMQGQTVAQGWDVVCAVAIEQINAWFVEQYVSRLASGQDPVIDGVVPLPAGLSVELTKLTLSPPLISFSPTLAPQEAYVTMHFLSGQVNLVQAQPAIRAKTILTSQRILPGDGLILAGIVPLASVQGEVNGHDIVIDIPHGSAFSANLLVGGASANLLGEYLKSWLITHLDGYQYKLGTLDYGDNGTNLRPAGTFDFATQVDLNDKSDAGRLLLFIPTTYHAGGGAQTALSIANIVPQGRSSTLIVSSPAFFGNILASYYETTFPGSGVICQAVQGRPGGSYALAITAGNVNAGIAALTFGTSYGTTGKYFSGVVKPQSDQTELVQVAMAGIGIMIAENQLVISGTTQWNQHLGWDVPVPKSEGFRGSGTVSMQAQIHCSTVAAVTPVSDVVSFTGKATINVTFDASKIYDDYVWDGLEQMIAGNADAALENAFSVGVPEVNAFAVSNLLFPGKNILSFESVYVPGDLVLFGAVRTPTVVVGPASATLGPGQTQAFSASAESPVTWSTKLGTVSETGFYTAPSVIGGVASDLVTATHTSTGDFAAAVITLVPDGVHVSPDFTMMLPAAQAQQFYASVPGGDAEDLVWTLQPSVGTLSAHGLYTPPDSAVVPQAVVITTTSQSKPGIHGSALIVLCSGQPSDVAVLPAEATKPLTPGMRQQFTAKVGRPDQHMDQTVDWTILPNQGHITPAGLYIAPVAITAPATVLVMATSTLADALYGSALVTLVPA